MDEEELKEQQQLNELQRLKDWHDYYYAIWKKTDKIKYNQKSIVFGEQVKIGLRNSSGKIKFQFYQENPEWQPRENEISLLIFLVPVSMNSDSLNLLP